MADREARVWRGSGETDLVPAQQGIIVSSTPLGHPSFVEGHLEKKAAEQRTLLGRISLVPDLQSARAIYLLRVVEPQAVAEYARVRDDGTWNCLCHILHMSPEQGADTRSSANLRALSLGCWGCAAARVSVVASWASWADCLPMVQTSRGGQPVPGEAGGLARHPHSLWASSSSKGAP